MKKIYLASILLIASIFVLPKFAGAIGQMTKPIIFENVLRGETVKDVLTLYNSEALETNYGLAAEGDIKNWATFYTENDLTNPITTINIPANAHINAIVKFAVPKDAPNNTYTGQIIFSVSPKLQSNTKEGMNVAVTDRIGREVSITITDQEITKFTTAIIPLKYAVANGDPLRIKIVYDNQGNVLIKPSIDLKILKDNKTVFNAVYSYPEGDEGVKLFSQREIPVIEWPTGGQENGAYKAIVKVLLNGNVVQEKTFAFNVGHDISWYLALLANLGPGKWGMILAGIAIVIVFGFAMKRFMGNKKMIL